MDRQIGQIMRSRRMGLILADIGDSVSHAVELMNGERIGSVLVICEQRLAGIFTERDVLTRIVAVQADPMTTRLGEVMSSPTLCIPPQLSVESAMQLMTEHRTRHLPVVESGVLIGLVSLGDLTRWLTRDLEHSVDDLYQYIAGPAALVEHTDERYAGCDAREPRESRVSWVGLKRAHEGARVELSAVQYELSG